MLEINNFLNIGKTSPVVDNVIELNIVFFERDVVHNELSITCREGLCRDRVVVSIFLGFLVIFCWCCLSDHLVIIVKEYIKTSNICYSISTR